MNFKDITFKVKRQMWMSQVDETLMRAPKHKNSKGNWSDAPYFFIEDSKGGIWEFVNSDDDTFSHGKLIEDFPDWFRDLFKQHTKNKLPPRFAFSPKKVGYRNELWAYMEDLALEVFPKLISNWKIKQGLSPGAAKTFNNLIDEL
jgi:hypothetical protein